MAPHGWFLGGKREKLTRNWAIDSGSSGEGIEKLHGVLTGPKSLKRSDVAVRK